ncbi:MAG TPA: hypothetical protein VHC39_15035 [Rhizomicrobium sp.]|nr:hypothetical protein [Rhizomicrobium sp.]
MTAALLAVPASTSRYRGGMSFPCSAAGRGDVSAVMAAIPAAALLWNHFSLSRYLIVWPIIFLLDEGVL